MERATGAFAGTGGYGWKRQWDGSVVDGSLSSLIYADRLAAILELVLGFGLPPGAKIAEVGCGGGALALALAKQGYAVEAVDLRPDAVELVRQRAADRGLDGRMTATVGDACALGLADESVAAALAIGVLWSVRAPAECVRELARIVQPDGYVIVSARNPAELSRLLDPRRNPFLGRAASSLLRGLRAAGWSGAADAYVPQGLYLRPRMIDRVLREAGLRKIGWTGVGYGPWNFLGHSYVPLSAARRLHTLLQRLADRGVPGLRRVAADYVVVARKPAR